VGKADEVADDLKKFSVSGKIAYYDIYGNEYDPSMKDIPKDLTAEKVIEDYITSIGGRENVGKIDDLSMKLKGTVQNLEINVEIFRKAPNKTLTNVDAGVMKQTVVFDGEQGKQTAMGQETIFEGERLEEMKVQSILNSFLDFEKHGIKTELAGISKVNGKDAYKVVLTMPNQKQGEQYFDTETGLKLREVTTTTTEQGTFSQSTDYDNYKEVEGVLFPFKVTQQMGPGTIDMEVVSLEINTGLDDKIFEMK
jgi:hypothetical protein